MTKTRELKRFDVVKTIVETRKVTAHILAESEEEVMNVIETDRNNSVSAQICSGRDRTIYWVNEPTDSITETVEVNPH